MVTTKLSTKQDNRFNKVQFSLKWKIVTILSVILIIINGSILIHTYNSLDQQFVSQQEQLLYKQQSENDRLIAQTYRRLVDFVDIFSMFSQNNSELTVKKSLDSQWLNIQILFDIKSALLLNIDKETVGQWGEPFESQVDEIVDLAIKNQQPTSRFFCRYSCSFYLASPILEPDGKISILVVSHSVANWLINLKEASGAETGIISVKQFMPNHVGLGLGDKILPQWNANIIGLTNPKSSYPFIQQVAEAHSLEVATKQSNFIENGNKSINVKFLPLDTKSQYYPAYLVLINDITDSRNKITDGVYKALVIAIIGIFVTLTFILLSLWRPINRLSILSRTLPLLARGRFKKVQAILLQGKRKPVLHDELDTLDDTALSLTGQLQSLEKEVKIREDILKRNALYDELTGLANRRLFMDRISQNLTKINRNQEQFAVLFIDLDLFKRINDSLGHDQGDRLLLEVASRLKQCVRDTDTVARIGGDEFTVLIKHLDNTQRAGYIAEKILNELRKPIILLNKQFTVTASIGISIAPDNGEDPETILRNADLAMYKAKGFGRDHYHFYTAAMNSDAHDKMELENDLREALENDEFFLQYQPQICLNNAGIIGLEALLRWNSPKRGLVPPYLFIDALEDTGLIVPLGEKILDMAAKQAKLWSKLDIGKFKVAVNLSARQFRDPNLVKCIQSTLSKYHLDSDYLEMEITESMLMDDIEEAIDKLHQLKLLGLSLSIDDFGTGYSSLSYLKQFPVDILKVDREFVKDIPNNESDMAISSAVIAMAHKLGMVVVAEGIETIEQIAFLKQNDCEMGQGYIFDKPLDANEATDRLIKNNYMKKINKAATAQL
jgi:diguanylate cyclase (GGDEF)-like protein